MSHSQDLEDPDHRPGLPRRHRLHGQRLHEGAGTPPPAARVRAVSSPAHPHQGEPPPGPAHTVKDWLLAALCPRRSSPGVTGTTPCSTTLTPTLSPTATRAPTTETAWILLLLLPRPPGGGAGTTGLRPAPPHEERRSLHLEK